MCGGEGAMPSGNAGMGFVIPFKGNLESTNPLVNIANQYVADGYTPFLGTSPPCLPRSGRMALVLH